MAMLITSGFSVVETNHVAAVRTGEIKAQYPMSAALALVGAQNGQLLTVDDVKKEIGLPAAATDAVYLHASEERIYEEHLGRNSFIVKSPNYPRMLKLSVKDIFETNAVDSGDFASLAAVKAVIADPIYAIPSTSGFITLKNKDLVTTTYNVVLQLVEVVTLPNEAVGFKFVVIKA